MNNIKKARLIAGMEQKKLAESMGVSQVSVSAWEHGKALPKPCRLRQLADVLNTTVEELISDRERAV